MSWELKKLNEIVFVKSGKRLPKGHSFVIEPTNHPYIRARDIKNGKIKVEAPVYINDDTFNIISRYTVSENDVVITIVGANVGDIAFIDSEYDGANLTENAAKLIPKDSNTLSPRFLKYSLFGDVQKSKFQQIAMAAAQPKLGFYKIKDFEINVPNIKTQKRIADILSSYDDLIENNLKRIKLLEQAAQNIYKEWFVNMRFPGHENVAINEETGLPVGWKNVMLSDFIEFKNGKSLNDKELSKKYIVYGSNGVIGKSSVYNRENSIIIGRVGAYCGSINYCRNKYWATDNTITASAITAISTNVFCKLLLKNMDLRRFAGGAAQPLLTQRTINGLVARLPPFFLIEKFTSIADVNKKQTDNLSSFNHSLKSARDILLPRLMNRTIAV